MNNNKMKNAVKNTMAAIISESTGANITDIKKWLETVNTADDFFGNNKQGLAEYNAFIASRENAYRNAQRRSLKGV
ncbi:MAG: hypothetical protein FWC41_00735 [Firmicutes bacterium]|nr:hypothetical protein [Bacillota bacterium]